MKLQLSVIFLSTLLVTQAWLFGGPPGGLLPNNPVVCTTKNITLTCTVNDASYTSADIRFNISNVPVPENRTTVVDSSSRSLTFTNVTMKDDHANIMCCVSPCNEATHIVGFSGIQILEVYDYPVHVVNFTCIRFGWENIMTCTWSLGQNYRRLPNVAVHWRIPKLTASWTPCPDVVSREQCHWPGASGSVGHRDIQVQVNVTSQCGITVTDIFDVNTANIIKPEPLKAVQVMPVKSTCLDVKWNYTISYNYSEKQYKIELESKWNDQIEPYYRIQADSNDTMYNHMFCGLVPNTVYTIHGWVKPMTEGFWSDVRTTTATTPKDVPFASPEVTGGGYMWDPSQCEIKDRRTVYLYYKPIPAIHKNGLMREITATSQIPFYSNSIPKYKTEVPAHHTQMSVELDCYHDYSFEITAVNEMGAAAKVSKFDIPKVASGVKIPEIIVETSGSLVHLNWTVEAGIEPTGFTVFWCKRDRGNCNKTVPVQWNQVLGDRNTWTQNISSPEEFLYSVSMETDEGSTGMSWESCIYAMHAEPQQYPDTPTVSKASVDNTLSVYWNRIECASGSRYFPLYKVVYCEWGKDIHYCSATPKEILVPAKQTSVVIEGLKENVKYGVMVQGVTADGQAGPVSEPAFGVPENKSLKPVAIGFISAGSLFGFAFIIAGAVAIFRYCNKERKKRFKLPDIDDIPITTDENQKYIPNGYINQNYSNYSLPEGGQTVIPTSQPYKQTNGYITHNDLLHDMMGRAERQTSVDSGYPEDPMTPRPLGETVNFPERIDEMASQQSLEAPVTPDGVKIVPGWSMLPTGYSRVNTEEDSIPRIKTDPHINDESEPDRQTNFGLPLSDYLDVALVVNLSNIAVTPQKELAVFRVQTDNNFSPRNRDKMESQQSNTDKTERKSSVKAEEKPITDPMSSYPKFFKIEQGEGNDNVESAENESHYIPHSTAKNDSDTQIMENTSVASSSANINLPHSSAHMVNTTFASSSPDNYLLHSAANLANTTVADSNANSYLPHSVANMANTTAGNSTANSYLPHSTANTANTTVGNSTANSYLPHSAADMVNTTVGNSTANSYLPHSAADMVNTTVGNSTANSYLPHSAADMVNTTVGNSTANSYLPHSAANMVKTTVANSTANSYLPHPTANMVNTPVVNTTANSYLPHPTANMVNTTVANSTANSYLPHPTANMVNTSVVNTTASSYLPHPTANILNTGVANSIANSYLPQSNANMVSTTLENSSASICLSRSNANSVNGLNLATTASNTNGYVSNEAVNFTSTTQSNTITSNTHSLVPHTAVITPGYISHETVSPVVNADTDAYLPNNQAVQTNADASLPQNTAVHANSDGYLPHNNPVQPSLSQNNPVQPSSDGYLPHTGNDSVKADSYLPHDNPANTDGYLPHNNPVNTDTNLPHNNLVNTDGYLPHNKPVNTDTNLPHNNPMNTDTNLPHNHPVNTDGYLPHNKLVNTDTNLPHNKSLNTETNLPHNKSVNTDTNLTHNNPVNTDGYLPHNNSVNTDTNLPHNNSVNTDTSLPHNNPANTDGHLPHNPVNTDGYLPNNNPVNTDINLPNNNPANTDGYLAHNSSVNTDTNLPNNNPANTNSYLQHRKLVQLTPDGYVTHNSYTEDDNEPVQNANTVPGGNGSAYISLPSLRY